MTDSELVSRAIVHLRSQFERGAAVLFTGAGFSLGGTNLRGTNPPVASSLKQELWVISFPGEPFDASASLADLYHAAVTRHRRSLEELLTQLYTMDTASLPDWYRTFFEMPWARCYTLNVDDLAQAVARKFDLPRRIRQVSAIAPGPVAPVDVPAEVFDVIHLNGVVTDGADGMTFSSPQYVQRTATPIEPWYIRLSADLLSHPFVFLGTQLDEPPLWQHLEMRRAKGGRGLRELRPKSYLVAPTLDLARRSLLASGDTQNRPLRDG